MPWREGRRMRETIFLPRRHSWDAAMSWQLACSGQEGRYVAGFSWTRMGRADCEESGLWGERIVRRVDCEKSVSTSVGVKKVKIVVCTRRHQRLFGIHWWLPASPSTRSKGGNGFELSRVPSQTPQKPRLLFVTVSSSQLSLYRPRSNPYLTASVQQMDIPDTGTSLAYSSGNSVIICESLPNSENSVRTPHMTPSDRTLFGGLGTRSWHLVGLWHHQ